MVDKQFWPRVGYGLFSNTASFDRLSSCLKKEYWQLIPPGGVIRSAKAEIRQLDLGFFGAGCPHPGIECLVGQTNKLLMHYGCQSSLGLKMQLSMELLITELGLSLQPFQQSYKRFGDWVTPGWLKSIWEKVDLFNIRIEVNNVPLQQPKRRDEWLMAKFDGAGFCKADLLRLNKVRKHQQVLFLSDVLCAQGKTIDRRYLTRRQEQEKWSTLRFPKEDPPRKDFRFWKQALQTIIPRGNVSDRLGPFIHEGYKIWDWRYDEEANELLHHHERGMDIYVPSLVPRYRRTPNRWTRSKVNRPAELRGDVCTVREVGLAVLTIVSHAPPAAAKDIPDHFLDVLQEWGCAWMWKNLQFIGGDDWIAEAITDNSLVACTDGSYIRELYPDLCSAAFIMECSRGRGRLVGAFPEKSAAANAYRGELLGLMAIHLLLLAVNKVNPTLAGSVHIYSDCLGALNKVEHLPPYRIPSRCRHSDILKNIMVNCSDLTFQRRFSHVVAHQDDAKAFHELTREAQLNCGCDAKAKSEIRSTDPMGPPKQKPFPLEPISIFVGQDKVTSDTGAGIRFWAHRQLARAFFASRKIMFQDTFDEVDWRHVHATLHKVPRLFATWACKQVMDLAGTNVNQAKYKTGHCKLCPSCNRRPETTAHVLHCNEAGRVDALHQTISSMDSWLQSVQTDPELRRCLVKYAKGRGGQKMEDIVRSSHPRFRALAISQDKIGWRRFMEGMISKECAQLQGEFMAACATKLSQRDWAMGLITRLLEVTHGQWLYRNVQVHDELAGVIVTQRKEEIQMEIERQQDLGEEGLLDEDKYLLEVNLGDLDSTSGDWQEYWLLAVKAAREAMIL